MKRIFRSSIIVLLAMVLLLPAIPVAAARKPLKITKQPVSVSAYSGETAKVTVKATGDGLKYIWYFRNAGSSSFSKTSSFKGNTYQVAMNTSRHGRQVYCKITDKYGKTVKTKTVTLSMNKALKIITQPTSVTVYSGKTAKVTTKISGFGLKYTWYIKNKGATKFSKSSVKTAEYSVTMSSKVNGRQLYCKVTDKYGKTVKTNTVKMTMAKTPKITKQPASVSAYQGKTATVTVTASGDGLKYAWYYKNVGSSKFSKTTAFTGNTYQVEMTPSRHGRQLYCVVTDKYGTKLTTRTVTLSTKLKTAAEACQACRDKETGTYFDEDTLFIQNKKLGAMPRTFEARFRLTAADIKEYKLRTLDSTLDYAEIVLFSNDDNYDKSVAFSVTEHGNPKVMLRSTKVYRKASHVLFDKVSVFSSKGVHLSITLDYDNGKAYCYLNGKLAQTVSIPKAAKDPITTTYRYVVAGDHYDANPHRFIGRLDSLAVWTDLRTAAEVNFDATVGLDTTDKALAAAYDMTRCSTCMQKDLSTKKNNLFTERLWLDKNEVEPVGDYDYSFAVIGDTQELSEDKPAAMTRLYKWLADNQESHKIEYVLGLGDITQKSYAKEWAFARDAIYQLNGKIPYLLARGNHDYIRTENGVINYAFNGTFDDGVYNQQLTGTMSKGDVSNAYRTINIGGIDYLFLTLDFGPNAEMIAWADSVVSAHPNHRVIITTHGYMYRDGTTIDKGDAFSPSKGPVKDRKEEQAEKPSLDGDEMWEQFVSKHENIQMVLSGHDPCQHVVYRQDKGDKGNVVTQMLIDPQGTDAYYEPTGMVAMFYFSDNGNRLTVRYYSVELDRYGTERSQFTIDLN